MGVGGVLERAVGLLPKYGRIFVHSAVFFEHIFRAFDNRRLRTFIGARSIPVLSVRQGGHHAYADWCFQSGVYAGLLSSFARSPLRVMDVGCGTGEIVAGVLQSISGDSVYLGVDIDQGLIEQCQRTFQDPRARFAVISGLSPFYAASQETRGESLAELCGEGRWDVIIVKAVFDHLSPKDAEAYLHLGSRGLGPDGIMIATFFLLDAEYRRPGGAPLSARFRFDDVYPGHPGFRYSAAFNPVPEAQLTIEAERLEELLAAAGLRIVRVIAGTWRDPQGPRGVDMPDILLLAHREQP